MIKICDVCKLSLNLHDVFKRFVQLQEVKSGPTLRCMRKSQPQHASGSAWSMLFDCPITNSEFVEVENGEKTRNCGRPVISSTICLLHSWKRLNYSICSLSKIMELHFVILWRLQNPIVDGNWRHKNVCTISELEGKVKWSWAHFFAAIKSFWTWENN